MKSKFLARSLHWDGEHGTANYRRGTVPLTRAPRIAGRQVLQVSYSPIANERMILYPEQPNEFRRMTDAEVADVDEKLARMLIVGESVWK